MCVHPTPLLKQPAAAHIYHRSPDRAQMPMQPLCIGRRELIFFEHLLCAAQYTEPFTCAFFLKLFTSPEIYFTDSEPETQRDDPHHTMGGLPAWNGTSGSSPLSHPYFSAEEKSSKGQNLSAVGSDE